MHQLTWHWAWRDPCCCQQTQFFSRGKEEPGSRQGGSPGHEDFGSILVTLHPSCSLPTLRQAIVPSQLQQQATLLSQLSPSSLRDKYSALLNPTSGLAVLFHYLLLRRSSPELLNDPGKMHFRIFISSSFAKRLLLKKAANNHICSALKWTKKNPPPQQQKPTPNSIWSRSIQNAHKVDWFNATECLCIHINTPG